MSPERLRSAVLTLLVLLPAPLLAQITNGSFEDAPNHLNGWTLGPGARVEALQAGDFGPNPVPAPDGAWLALLSTGPGDVPGAPGGDFDANGTNDFDGSTLSTTFTTTVAGEKLSFQWAFLTDEVGPGAQGRGLYDDLFDITLDGISIVRGSVRKPGGSSPFPDTAAYDGLRYTVSSPGLTDNSDFGTAPGGGRTPFQRVCLAIADPGTYTLELRVADQADSVFDSGLAVDAVEVGSTCDPLIQVTSSAGASLEVKGGSLQFRSVRNGRPAASGTGDFLAFRSNGDLAGDNPNLQEEVWLATRNGASYDSARVTAAVGAEFGDPAISRNGRWLAFAATADLVPPGNADGNAEVFRYDRLAGTFTQITATAACQSRQPTINDGGDRVAFVSDCDLGFGAAGEEIVLWDGAFRGVDTAGCTSRNPWISRAPSGRWVTFLSSCDGDYPGTSNPDGGLEVLQWDTLTDTYLQITDTAAGGLNDAATSSADGRFVAFVSTADHQPGQNPFASLVVFRYDRADGSFLQLTDPDPLALYTFAALDDSGTFIAVERLDLLTFAFEIALLDATAPRVLFPVVGGGPTVSNNFPAVAVAGNRPLAAFVSNGDFSAGNADGNVEVWAGEAAFDPPDQRIYCSTPNLAIPDNNNQGVRDFLTVADTGVLLDLDVFLRIEHTFVGDLRVILRHVDTGVQRRMVNRPGAPPGFGCSGDDIEATLDDEAATSVEDECVTPGPVAIQGTFQPDRSLDVFDGLDLAGDWRLTVSDRAAGDTGTLVEWCLIATIQ